MFPDEEMLGIDLVLPDFTYVLEHRDKALGVLLTHGHEDHVGALPYLLREVDMPVYGTRLTLGLVNGKLGEHGLQGEVTLNEVAPGGTVELGPFERGVPAGVPQHPRRRGPGHPHSRWAVVIHTGDFKLDQTPVDCRVTAMHRFARTGAGQGVLLLMSDSTNAETPGFTQPERIGGPQPGRPSSPRRPAASSWPRSPATSTGSSRSSTRRTQHGRSVAVVGRSMTKNVNIASNLGYLNIPEGTLIRPQDIAEIPDDRLVILSTGSQGEPMSALARMASHDHHLLRHPSGRHGGDLGQARCRATSAACRGPSTGCSPRAPT